MHAPDRGVVREGICALPVIEPERVPSHAPRMPPPDGLASLSLATLSTQLRACSPEAAQRTLDALTLGGPPNAAANDARAALVGAFGPSLAGPFWGVGGPVDEFCCPRHQLRGGPNERREALQVAIEGWRDRVEALSEFAHHAKDDRGALDAVLDAALQWTDAQGDWAATAASCASWVLGARGHRADPRAWGDVAISACPAWSPDLAALRRALRALLR